MVYKMYPIKFDLDNVPEWYLDDDEVSESVSEVDDA